MNDAGQLKALASERGEAPDDAGLYRELVERANDLFVLVDGDGCVRFVNETFCRLTGFSRDEVEGERVASLFVPDERERAKARLEGALQAGGQGAVGLPLRTRDEQGIEISFRPTAVRAAGGALLRMVLVGQSPFLYGDLADQFNRLHRDLGNYSRRLERLNAELEQRIQERTSRLTALLEVSASLNAELQPDALFELVLRQATETIAGAQAGVLLLYDPQVDRLVVQAACGYEDDSIVRDLQAELERVHPHSIFSDRKVRVWAGEPRAKAGQMKHLLRNVDQYRIRSAISAPVATPSEPLGVLLLHNFDERDAFSSDDVALATSLAGSAAVAIVNARLYEETRQQAERLELVNRLSASVGDSADLEQTLGLAVLGLSVVLGASRVAVTLFDESAESADYAAEYSEPGSKTLAGYRSLLIGTPLLREVIAFRLARAVSEARYDPRVAEARRAFAALGVESILVVPLVVRERFVGTMELQQCDRVRRWRDAEISLAESVARQLATAVHQVRLHAKLREAVRESESLVRIVSAGKREWEAAFDAMSDAVYVFDAERRVVRANTAAAARDGRSPADLVGLGCCELFGDACPLDGAAAAPAAVDPLPGGAGTVVRISP